MGHTDERTGDRGRGLSRSLHRRASCGPGRPVRAFCRNRYAELDALGVETVEADMRDREATMAACRDVDVVFHVAGVAGLGGPWDYFCGINVWGTRYVVDGCLKHGVGRLVYTSSPSVTFDGSDQRGRGRIGPYARRWLCHYAHTKALAERHVLAANGLEGLLMLRTAAALDLGPARSAPRSAALSRARTGRLRRVGDGTT